MSNNLYCEKHKECFHMNADGVFHCTQCDIEIRKKPTVKLVGTDGNAFALMGRVSNALRNAGLGDQVKPFRDEAMSGDYNHLLQTCMKYVNVE